MSARKHQPTILPADQDRSRLAADLPTGEIAPPPTRPRELRPRWQRRHVGLGSNPTKSLLTRTLRPIRDSNPCRSLTATGNPLEALARALLWRAADQPQSRRSRRC